MTESLELYGSPACPCTSELRNQLTFEGRTFVEYDVDRDPAARARLKKLTGGRVVPTLVDRGSVVEGRRLKVEGRRLKVEG